MGDRGSLSDIIAGLVVREDPPTLGEAMEELGERGFGALMVILAFPAALPLPAAGYAVPFGMGILSLGIGLIMRRRSPWLPRRILGKRLPHVRGDFWGIRLLRRAEVLFRERPLGAGRFLSLSAGVVACLMGVLMMIPIPGTNTLPGAVAFALGLGLAYRDGVWILVACAAGIALLSLYVAVALGLVRVLGILGGGG